MGQRPVIEKADGIVVTVDDDRRVRDSIQAVMDSAGYASVVFASAEDFLQSGMLARTTCLIADVRMPGIDGLELQRRVRRDCPQLPVIFITAHDDAEVRQQALHGGAAAFMYKPFDAEDLLTAVEVALKSSSRKGDLDD